MPFPKRAACATIRRDSGFTLAGVLVVLTIIAIFVASTVPRAWSNILRRERERQAIWAMKQYVRGIKGFQRAQGRLPTTLAQLIEQKNPRVLRQLYPDPLTGRLDWRLIPPNELVTATSASRLYRGPFIGVAPGANGRSMMIFGGQMDYSSWTYTLHDLERDTAPR